MQMCRRVLHAFAQFKMTTAEWRKCDFRLLAMPGSTRRENSIKAVQVVKAGTRGIVSSRALLIVVRYEAVNRETQWRP